MGCAIRSSDSTSSGSLEFVVLCRIGIALLKRFALSINLTSGLMRSEVLHNDL